MTDEEKPPEPAKVSITGWLSIAFVLLFVVGGLLAFLKLFFEEGWSSATQKNPAGGMIFLLALAVGYFFAILHVEKTNKNAARKMIWVALAIGGFLVASLFPSCHDSERAPTDIYFRR